MISQTTDDLWDFYKELPENVREAARRAYSMWHFDHYHPGLHFKPLKDTTSALYSVHIGIGYRALGYFTKKDEQSIITWFWIGTHAEYDKHIESLWGTASLHENHNTKRNEDDVEGDKF